MTATSLRKNLFSVLEMAAHALPTRILYKKGDSIIISYNHFNHLLKKSQPDKRKLKPLIKGTIKRDLNEKSEEELLHYMGIE